MIRRQPTKTTFPLPSPSSPEGQRAAELHAEWIAQDTRVNILQRDRADASQALDDADRKLRGLLLEVEMSGKPHAKDVDAAAEALESAKATLAEPWAERIAAAEQAAVKKHGVFQVYVNDHLEAILQDAEVADASAAAHAAFGKALDAVDDSIARLGEQIRRHEFFVVHGAGVSGQDVPSLGILSEFRYSLEKVRFQYQDGRVPVPAVDPLALESRRELLATGVEPLGAPWR